MYMYHSYNSAVFVLLLLLSYILCTLCLFLLFILFLLLVPLDASFSDEMSDLGSDADASRGPTEPAVKRERIEMSHPLQEM